MTFIFAILGVRVFFESLGNQSEAIPSFTSCSQPEVGLGFRRLAFSLKFEANYLSAPTSVPPHLQIKQAICSF